MGPNKKELDVIYFKIQKVMPKTASQQSAFVQAYSHFALDFALLKDSQPPKILHSLQFITP